MILIAVASALLAASPPDGSAYDRDAARAATDAVGGGAAGNDAACDQLWLGMLSLAQLSNDLKAVELASRGLVADGVRLAAAGDIPSAHRAALADLTQHHLEDAELGRDGGRVVDSVLDRLAGSYRRFCPSVDP